VIRHVLKQHGVNAFAADELDLAGAPMALVLMEAVGRADIVIGVFGGQEESGNVLFELGVAQGLKKPTLIIAPHDEATSPVAPTGIPCLRAKPHDSAALEFGIALFLAAPAQGIPSPNRAKKETHPLRDYADALLAKLDLGQEHVGNQRRGSYLQDLIVEALKKSGVSTVSVDDKQGDTEIDIAVWCNDLEPWVRNPLLIEVRKYLRGEGDLDTLVNRFAGAFKPGLVNWALVIYGDAAPKAERLKHLHPNILLISAHDFLVSLRETGFGDLIRRLRNERVHGGW
jgi:hypothetical protein